MTAMEAFHKRVPNIGMSEYRSFTALEIEGLPSAEYGFMEFYCNDPSCDCRRVQLVVIAPEVTKRFLATISYGWESQEFYRKRFTFISEEDSPCEPILEPSAIRVSTRKSCSTAASAFSFPTRHTSRV